MSKGWACICRLGGIGDNLIAASVLRPLKRLGYMVEMMTSEPAASVYLNNPYIDKLTIKREGDIPGGDEWQKWFSHRANEYDLLINLSNSCETRHALQKAMTAFWWPPEYRRKLCAGSYLDTVNEIVGVIPDYGPLFFPTEEERTRALRDREEKLGGRILVWALSGSRLDKVYPYTAHAIARIIKELGINVVMMGTGGQQFQYAKIVQQTVQQTNSTDKGLHLALSPEGSDPGGHQNWSIRRSLTQALTADLVITPDTGVGWACAMEPMPKIVLVSHASAENITSHWVNTTTLHADPNRVPCWPCHRLHDDQSTCVKAADSNAAACMADIPVDTILQNVARLWKPESNVRALRAA